jgi:hypothetical protein
LEDIASPLTWIRTTGPQKFEIVVIGGSEGTERFLAFESPDLYLKTILGAVEEIYHNPHSWQMVTGYVLTKYLRIFP